MLSRTAMNLHAVEIKAFVPAPDFERSRQFYLDLGFEIPWSADGLAYVRLGSTAFLLQAFDAPGFSANFQMHLLVENVDDWHAHVTASGVAARFGVRVGEPEDRPWAMRDFTLFDPGGVLWRVAQPLPRTHEEA
jgi:catechol 2,3-dioxygenase-like lactoylglutathione lyase family enzyme